MSNDKRKEAVALKYNGENHPAPVVKAKGKGLLADKIIEAAKANDVPLYEDEALVELLGNLNLNETIPEELYKAVAEVFAFIYRLDKQEKE